MASDFCTRCSKSQMLLKYMYSTEDMKRGEKKEKRGRRLIGRW